MTIREEVYKIVRDVLLDGEAHRLSEIRKALADTLGLTSTQTASRLKYLVDHKHIINVERGYYKLGDSIPIKVRLGAKAKIAWSLRRVKEVVFATSMSSLEFLEISDEDIAALKILKDITALADEALALYEDDTNE